VATAVLYRPVWTVAKAFGKSVTREQCGTHKSTRMTTLSSVDVLRGRSGVDVLYKFDAMEPGGKGVSVPNRDRLEAAGGRPHIPKTWEAKADTMWHIWLATSRPIDEAC
jgi:hypothetical protein